MLRLTKRNKYLLIAVIMTYAIMISIFNLYESFLSDYKACRRDYDNETCLRKYIEYSASELQLGCYRTLYESYVPEINSTKVLQTNIYLGNTNLNSDSIARIFQAINKVWNLYGINFSINTIDISRVKENVDLKNIKCTVEDLTPKIGRYYNLSNDTPINVLIVGLGTVEGGCHINAGKYQVVVVSTKTKNLTWTITHELGHAVGLCDKAFYSGEVNLMTHSGCIRDTLYPTNLNRKQVDTIVNNESDSC